MHRLKWKQKRPQDISLQRLRSQLPTFHASKAAPLMSSLNLTPAQVDFLLSPKAIRERAEIIFKRTEQGQGLFEYHPEKFQATVDYVLGVIHKKYPDLNIPFHSRWGHFRAGGFDRTTEFVRGLGRQDALAIARAKLDLVITSVLLDAGAGREWS